MSFQPVQFQSILRLGSLAAIAVAGAALAGCGSGYATLLPLAGPATTPALSLSVPSLTFGTVTTGQSSSAQTVTVTNSGTGTLSVSNISVSGDFSQTSNGCPGGLAPNATCQIFILFGPTAAGTRAGTLTLTSNASPSTATLALSGAGQAPGVFMGQTFSAFVNAGPQPVTGANVQLYTAGTTGNGSAPTVLLTASATGTNGSSTIPAFSCPSASALIYAVGRGGTVAGASSPNPNIAFMTALGPCSAISAGTKIKLNEATTIAAVYALAPFLSVGGAVGASATNLLGLTNAFGTAATLVDAVAGTSPGTGLPSNAISPAPRVNSLANILNACSMSSGACNALYTATASNGAFAANTLDAAYFIARSPANNVASLYSQSVAGKAYAPALKAMPTDWTMFVNFSGGGLDSPSGLGVDSSGNVWVASYFNAASKFTSAGAPVFSNGVTTGGLNNSYGLAIDLSDDVWIPNEQPFTAAGIGSVTELSPSGSPVSGGSGYTAGGLNYPLSVAIDPNGTVWVVDYGNSHLTLLNTSGTPLSGNSGYTTPLFAFPVAVALDSNHFAWIVNQSSDNVTKVSPDGSSFTNFSCCTLASGIAIDQGNNVWVANYFGDSVSLLNNSGAVISNNYKGAGSIYHPQGIAIDGAGSVWVANYRAPNLTELSGSASAVPGTSLTPAAGLGADAGLLEAYAIALDASGNIWVSNQGSNTITKFIGLATPVKTPLSGLPKIP